MSTAAQPTLFPDAVAPASSRCTGKRGRGATPITEFELRIGRANPCGRRKLTFRYRPLKRHSMPYRLPSDQPSTLGVATKLLESYFQFVGGFRQVDDAIMRAWCDALADYTPEEIGYAIAAKAASLQSDDPDERRAKRMFANAPANFVRASCLDYWLEAYYDQHPRARPRDPETVRQLDELQVKRQPETPAALQPRPIPDGLPPYISLALEAGEYRFHRRVWEAMGDKRRKIVDRHLHANQADYRSWWATLGEYFNGDPGAEYIKRVQFALRVQVAREMWVNHDYDQYRVEDAQ